MHCFMLAVSQASTLDRYTNNFSLFFLLEEVTPAGYPARLKVHSHAFFEVPEEERKVEHEVRLALVSGERDCFFSDPLKVKPGAERHRVRMNGLVVPEPGQYRVHIEWRPLGTEDWMREATYWPIKANNPLQ